MANSKRPLLMKLKHVYFVSDGTYMKIGRGSSASARMQELQTGTPYRLRLLAQWCVPAGKDREVERHLHTKLAQHRLRGEWFTCSMEDVAKLERECFYLAFGEGVQVDLTEHRNPAVNLCRRINLEHRWPTLDEMDEIAEADEAYVKELAARLDISLKEAWEIEEAQYSREMSGTLDLSPPPTRP